MQASMQRKRSSSPTMFPSPSTMVDTVVAANDSSWAVGSAISRPSMIAQVRHNGTAAASDGGIIELLFAALSLMSASSFGTTCRPIHLIRHTCTGTSTCKESSTVLTDAGACCSERECSLIYQADAIDPQPEVT